MRKAMIVLFVLLSFALSFALYNKLPDQVASHWNSAGEVNGYMSKVWGAFFVPLLTAFMAALLLAVPYIDPLKNNIKKFKKQYDTFIVVLVFFMLTMHTQMLLWNSGYKIPFNRTLPVALGVFFIYLGSLLSHAKRNWFIGIRTPWTLSSDKVWDKTHALGSKLFKIAGVIACLGVFTSSFAIWFIIVPVFAVTLITIIYSYIIYRA